MTLSVRQNSEMLKSLGFSSKRVGPTLDDVHLGKLKDLYHEMMQASQEAENQDVDSFVHTDLTRLKDQSERRRSIMASPAGKRRARSQAIRREKLNSQSLRSHFVHSRHNNFQRR